MLRLLLHTDMSPYTAISEFRLPMQNIPQESYLAPQSRENRQDVGTKNPELSFECQTLAQDENTIETGR